MKENIRPYHNCFYIEIQGRHRYGSKRQTKQMQTICIHFLYTFYLNVKSNFRQIITFEFGINDDKLRCGQNAQMTIAQLNENLDEKKYAVMRRRKKSGYFPTKT